jgi:hypothetical protein
VKLGHPVPESYLSSELNKRLTADHIHVNALFFIIRVWVLTGRLGAVLLRDFILDRGQCFLQSLIIGLFIGLSRKWTGLAAIKKGLADAIPCILERQGDEKVFRYG